MIKSRYSYQILAFILGITVSLLVVGDLLFDDTVVQDDFRQSMFWVWRFWDPTLFPQDFITSLYADSFDRLPLLLAIYKIAPLITNNLIFFSKLVAIIIAALTTMIGYLFFEKLSGNKIHALAFALALAITLWCTDHVAASHARSFIWLFILNYMFLKSAQYNLMAILSIFISLLISPIAFLITLVMEGFDLLINSSKNLFNYKSIQVQGLIFNSACVIVIYKLFHLTSPLLPFPDGEPYSLEEIKNLAEFNPGGRHPIFGSTLWDGSWWFNENWGMGIGFLPISQIIPIAIILAAAYLIVSHKNFNFLALFKSNSALLVYASLSLYFFSQFTFPLLYMPSRYIGISSIIISLIIIFMVLPKLLSIAFSSFKNRSYRSQAVTSISLIIFSFSYTVYFLAPKHQYTRYVKMDTTIKKFYDQLPPNVTLVAHPLLPDINLVSAICKRSIFMSYEHSRPYFANKKIIEEVRRRNVESLKMTYASSPKELWTLMKENKVTHIIAFAAFYSPQYLSKPNYNKPYIELLSELVQKDTFFLAEFLKKKGATYSIIPRDLLLDFIPQEVSN